MLISFSQGLISELYGGMNKHMILSFLKKFWICFVRWNLQLSATITIFLWSTSCLSFALITNSFKNFIYYAWLNVVLVPIIPSTPISLWPTTKLILKSVGFFKSLPGIPFRAQPYVFIVFLLIRNSSTNIK